MTNYVYLRHLIKRGKENQTVKIENKVCMTFMTKFRMTLKKKQKIRINLKRGVFNYFSKMTLNNAKSSKKDFNGNKFKRLQKIDQASNILKNKKQ